MIRQLTDPRELRGLAILSQPGTVIQENANEWDVRSQSINAYYHVTRTFQDRHARMRGQAVWTPAQMANIPINLMGNRWETMIGLAVTK